MKSKPIVSILCFLIIAVLISSCSNLFSTEPTPTMVEPTPTDVPITAVTICTAVEPETLFYYGKGNEGTDLVFNAIYDGPFDRVDYLSEPVILESLPSLSSGSASYTPVEVNGGDTIIDVEGNVTALTEGVRLYPRDCRSTDCAITWDGVSLIQMDQLTLVFKLKDGLRWSDGADVTAGDSQYSFRIAEDLGSTAFQDIIDRIVDYQVLDDSSVMVTIFPGLVTSNYASYFFTPLPQHVWSSYAPADLAAADDAAKLPLAYGPFQITEWLTGESITLNKNEYYFRSSEGYPAVDRITIKFVDKDLSLNELLENENCDVVDQSLIDEGMNDEVVGLQGDSEYRVEILPGDNWEVLLFGIKPSSYDDGYYPYGSDRPDLLSDVNVRNAIEQCIDRDVILQQAGIVGNDQPFAYFPYDVQESAEPQAYDPVSAAAVLDAAGWKDYDSNPDTPRVAYGVDNVQDGTAFTLNLYTTTGETNSQIAELIKSSLSTCGIQTAVNTVPAAELYAAGPDGVLFGRSFDLALISWNVGDVLPCALFESSEIPSEENYWIGNNDGGGNIAGYQNTEFDILCNIARYGSSDPGSALNAQIQAAQLLDRETPFVSLFFDARIFVSKSALCIGEKKESEKYPYSFLEYWDFRDTCN